MSRLGVFDVDGTLVDSRRSIARAMDAAFEALGLPAPGYERTRHIVGLSLQPAASMLAPDLPPEKLPILADAYTSAFIRHRAEGLVEPLYEGARELLIELKDTGWRLGIATGKARRGLDFFLDKQGLADLFDCSFCADDGPGKPHPHMLDLNMKALGFAPQHTVMIGDTSHDMQMARAAKVFAQGVTWGFHTREEIAAGGASHVAEDFTALRASLQAWRGS